ncbi:MAG: hypothetical protein CL578_14655 [Alteromonadaceae bacterium]|uniref:hypothetical protein n=1 Tax=Paraglaciecola chathamensis TaxID=368405 RepID=UPI000C5AFCBF|nr:hypothetical protein [Paraglaciecola agarilytica]MBN26279.1 hypothetical protein [Alteromonadaceae bacterium]|tara:strand:- start:102761 stop:103273 length:513 start_codon:yes stop_codon:yes gene_type:complete
MNQENRTYHYGVTSHRNAVDLAMRVCTVLGHGRLLSAPHLLLETAGVETNLGTFIDPTPGYAGFGLTQGDPIGVKDVAARTRYDDIKLIRNCFLFDLRELKPIDLENDPLKAMVFTRCFYKLIPDEIPATLAGRARYWKTHYNTKFGKGTVSDYIKKAQLYVYGGPYGCQ